MQLQKSRQSALIEMHARFIQFTESETQNYPSVNNYCSAALTIDVVTKEREKVSHTRQRYHKRRYHAARIPVAETMSNSTNADTLDPKTKSVCNECQGSRRYMCHCSSRGQGVRNQSDQSESAEAGSVF